MGFLTDEAVNGKAHYNKALAIGHAQANTAGDMTLSAKMGEDMGLMTLYLKGVVGPKVMYDVELTGMQYKLNRLRGLWQKLLSKAALIADDDERGLFLSRRDSFTRKTGLMSETTEVPWDIQVQGRAAGLWRRFRTQRNTIAGESFTKPLLEGTARQALGRHMESLLWTCMVFIRRPRGEPPSGRRQSSSRARWLRPGRAACAPRLRWPQLWAPSGVTKPT